MKTGAILIGVVAIAVAVPAVPTRKESLVPSAATISARQHIGCEEVGKDHKCSYYKDDAKIEVRSEDYHDAPVYSPTHAEYKPSTYAPPGYTSAYPEYKSSSEAYDRPKRTSANPAYRSTPISKTYDLPKSSSTPPEYKWTPSSYAPPKYTLMHSEYKPTTKYPVYKPTHELYSAPTPSHGRRGKHDPYELPIDTPPSPPEYRSTPSKPTHYGSPAYSPPSLLAYKLATFAYTLPSPSQRIPAPSSVPYEKSSSSKVPHGDGPEESRGGQLEGLHGGRPQRAYGAKLAKSTSSPFCNFVESECVDCNEQPDSCDTCDFMFKCGKKKQCSYHGFRETMTLCKEIGEVCQWPSWSEDEYDAPGEGSEKSHGGNKKPQGGSTDHSKVSDDEYVPTPFHGPHSPKGSEKSPVPKPVEYPVQGPENGTEYPHGHVSPLYAPGGKKVKST
ncbi:hypothetical protein BKA63DRAFT_558396 [Paraphoma chrysanthemicola]|nr:hypothetical protein BKA63DRAFT_558396 [Paraphoma chrysanthemicola]